MRHNYKIFNFTKWNASSLFKIRCLLHFGILSTWTDYLPTYLTWTIVDIWLTTYLPHLVHVVCEWPLSERDRGFWITVSKCICIFIPELYIYNAHCVNLLSTKYISYFYLNAQTIYEPYSVQFFINFFGPSFGRFLTIVWTVVPF